MHGLARILCKLVIIFISFFYLTGVRYSPSNFAFLLSEDVKQTDSLWLGPPEQESSGSSLANSESLSYVKWYRWLFINYPC